MGRCVVRVKISVHLPALLVMITLFMAAIRCWGQAPAAPAEQSSLQDSIRDLQQQVYELRSAILEMKAESSRYGEETLALRHELEQARGAALTTVPASMAAVPQTTDEAATDSSSRDQQPLAERITRLEEDQQLLSGKVDDQYQTKVESASKYKVRLSGIVLFNLAGNSGAVDNIDFPTLA